MITVIFLEFHLIKDDSDSDPNQTNQQVCSIVDICTTRQFRYIVPNQQFMTMNCQLNKVFPDKLMLAAG